LSSIQSAAQRDEVKNLDEQSSLCLQYLQKKRFVERTEICGSASVEAPATNNGQKIVTAAVFIAIGIESETALLTGLVEVDGMGRALVHVRMQTSVPGLFAVGSARQGSSRQISSITGDGVTAAIFSHRYIFQISPGVFGVPAIATVGGKSFLIAISEASWLRIRAAHDFRST
jgi:thioredoxin reductase